MEILIGDCDACFGQMTNKEIVYCECGAQIHRGCLKKCAWCDYVGCLCCMVKDKETGELFCPDSDCQDEYKEFLKIEELRKENDNANHS